MIIFNKIIVKNKNLLICLKYNVVKLIYILREYIFFFYVFLKLNSCAIFDIV